MICLVREGMLGWSLLNLRLFNFKGFVLLSGWPGKLSSGGVAHLLGAH